MSNLVPHKTALVTGVGRLAGMGAGIARRLAAGTSTRTLDSRG
ncbi:hypothetical protein [Arthrobacter sp. ES3-54]|nr:hypothetical protein [Arthrobacter sp. ES3-54]MDF9751157.1 NAD(P)-dependent dehydrogenase (short-subunit alcohol dehydrogenase family) [Arthrobacter sp. ES3-54]